jgi:hypothetical protein
VLDELALRPRQRVVQRLDKRVRLLFRTSSGGILSLAVTQAYHGDVAKLSGSVQEVPS